MDQPEAGPSRSPASTSRQPENGSSDDIEEVPLAKTRTTKGKSRAKPKPRAVSATVAEDASPAQPVARFRRIPRAATTRTAARPPTITTRSTTNANSKGKGKQVDKDETILVEESTDEDEPMFVGESIAKKLASKFTFQSTTKSKSKSNSSLSSSSSSSVVVVGVKDRPIVVEDEKPQPPPLPLLPPLDPIKAPPVPAWLGRTAVLLQIPYCVVCRVRWKKENGAARWVSLQPE